MVPMCRQNLEQVLAIECASYRYPWTTGIFEDCLRVGYSCWVLGKSEVAEPVGGQTIAGYAILTAAAGEAHILNLVVDPELRGRGLGKRLLARMIDLARWHNAKTVFLEVRPSNQAAVRLYSGAGFETVGTRNGYYPAAEGREDAWVMSKQVPLRIRKEL